MQNIRTTKYVNYISKIAHKHKLWTLMMDLNVRQKKVEKTFLSFASLI